MAKWKHTEAAKAKMREAMLGRKRDEATKRKISATLRRKWKLIREIERATAA
jgi:hypothetical protein